LEVIGGHSLEQETGGARAQSAGQDLLVLEGGQHEHRR